MNAAQIRWAQFATAARKSFVDAGQALARSKRTATTKSKIYTSARKRKGLRWKSATTTKERDFEAGGPQVTALYLIVTFSKPAQYEIGEREVGP